MIGNGQECASAVRFYSNKRNVIPSAHDYKTKQRKRTEHALKRSIYRKLSHALEEC